MTGLLILVSALQRALNVSTSAKLNASRSASELSVKPCKYTNQLPCDDWMRHSYPIFFSVEDALYAFLVNHATIEYNFLLSVFGRLSLLK